jgi:hypothetical protein
MTTKRIARSATTDAWWKAWVLLTGLGVTVLGWVTLPRVEPTPANGSTSSPVVVSAENAPGLGGERRDQPRRGSTVVGTLPGMPAKPVFQAPITRTRRS